jgi:ADP-ribose diphosphatase
MKILDATVINKGRFMSTLAVTYEDQRGNTKQWQMVSRQAHPKCLSGNLQRPDAVIIVPYHRLENKLVVIREFRVPVGGFQYGFPAGLLDAGENMVDSAARELHEETGLTLVSVYRHSPAIFSSAGITDEAVSMVFVEVEGTPATHHNEASEDIEVFLMDCREVNGLLQRTDIVFGARAWLVMDAFARMGKDYLKAPV